MPLSIKSNSCDIILEKFFFFLLENRYKKTTNGIKMSNPNPYMTCDVCCAFFRVSFYWTKANDAGDTIPARLTEQISLIIDA